MPTPSTDIQSMTLKAALEPAPKPAGGEVERARLEGAPTSEICPDCMGSGEYADWGGVCPTCDGTGGVSALTSPEAPQASEVVRLPTREEAAKAAKILLRCNGYDLDVWTDGVWPCDEATDGLRALTKIGGDQ